MSRSRFSGRASADRLRQPFSDDDRVVNLAELVKPLLPGLRHILLPSPRNLDEHLRRHRFDYLNLAIELPALLHDGISRHRKPWENEPTPLQPPSAGRRWLQLGAAFAAGAGLARMARNRAG